MALLAGLATADRYECSRVWLQQMLWGSRAQKQAQSSFRRELSNLRKVLAKHGLDLIRTDTRRVILAHEDIYIDVRDDICHENQGEFCEGLDLANEEGFEDWLRETRAFLKDNLGAKSAALPSAASKLAPLSSSRLIVMPTVSLTETSSAKSLATRVGSLISDRLSRIRWLPVVSAGSGFELGGAEDSSETNSDKSEGCYLVNTEVVATRSESTVNFRLLEMPGGIVRWSSTRTFKGNIEGGLLRAEIERAANCLSVVYDNCQQRRFVSEQRFREDHINDLNWRIRFLLNQATRKSLDEADRLTKRAEEINPEHDELIMLRAHLELAKHWASGSDPKDSSHLMPFVGAAIRANPADARGPLLEGVLDTWRQIGPNAVEQLKFSIELDPSCGTAFSRLGKAYALLGDPEAALEPQHHALFLTPLDPIRFVYLGGLAMTYWMLERYEEAQEVALRAQTTHPRFLFAHLMETASLSAMGRWDEASQARAKLLDSQRARYRLLIDKLPFHDPRWNEKLRGLVDFQHGDSCLDAQASG